MGLYRAHMIRKQAAMDIAGKASADDGDTSHIYVKEKTSTTTSFGVTATTTASKNHAHRSCLFVMTSAHATHACAQSTLIAIGTSSTAR